MGFRAGAYAKIWDVSPMSDTSTKLRLSISRKNKKTGEFEEDFSGFVLAIGTANAAKGDRIKLGDVDVSTKYDRDSKTTYVNYKLFSFELSDAPAGDDAARHNDHQPDVDGGDPDDGHLPF